MFSENLINQTRAYFNNRFGYEISVSEAEEYLDSLADLYLVFSDLNGVIKKGSPAFPAPEGGGKAADLISPHNC